VIAGVATFRVPRCRPPVFLPAAIGAENVVAPERSRLYGAAARPQLSGLRV